MRTVTVTIGRNVPSRHADAAVRDGHATTGSFAAVLTDLAWADFTTLIVDALETYADVVEADSYWVEQHDGLGVWDGVEEQSRKVTLLLEPSEVLEARWQSAREDLVIDLLRARTGYYQDAVAVSFGESSLI
jgi:hypothetical protein